jgi:hypothetical protein
MSSDTRIHSLRIAAATDCRAAVASALEQIDWPLAAADEILILRRIHVGGPLPAIGRLAQQQAQQTAAQAVDGWHANAEQAEAVRFKDQADLLACLLRDLARRRRCWFWRGWLDLFHLRAGDAIARVMDAEALRWPAVMQRLASRDAAAAVWRALTPEAAQSLLRTLARATGWDIANPVANPVATPDAAAGGEARDRPRARDADITAPASFSTATTMPLSRPPVWLQAVIAASADGVDQPLPRLALVTWLWCDAPQILSTADAARRVSGMLQAMRPAAGGVAGPTRDATVSGSERFRRDVSAAIAASTAASPTSPCAFDDSAIDNVARSDVTVSPAAPDAVTSKSDTPADQQPAESDLPGRHLESTSALQLQPAAAFGSPDASPGVCPDIRPDISRCYTSQGGWLLLLNALNQANVLSRLQAPDTPPYQTSGWIWLYRIGRALGGQADAALARFLAEAAGFAEPDELENLPPLPDEIGLIRLVQGRYGEVVRDAGLFQMPALLLASRSHLDVHYRMRDIRLDVRRVALDINPGWLPWLGRVVNFHYGQAPELM